MQKKKLSIHSRYSGIHPHIPDKEVRRYYAMERDCAFRVYAPGSVDYVFFEQKVSLNAETARYLYSRYTRTGTAYKKGSRPFLEAIVKKVTSSKASRWEKALALFRWCRDIYLNYPNPLKGGLPFFGGTEEEIIKKGSNRLCNETARVFCVLCQIAGIPARYVGMWPGFGPAPAFRNLISHAANEVFVGGRWIFMDTERGIYYLKADGRPASCLELKADPGICGRQLARVKKEAAPGYRTTDDRVLFSKKSEIALVNYYVENFAEYRYPWVWNTE